GARLPGRAGARAPRLVHVRRAQPAGGPSVRRGGPEDHAAGRRPMSGATLTAELATPARSRMAAAVPAGLLRPFVLLAVGAPLLAPADPPRQSLLARLRPPGTRVGGLTHWLGTDELGRDLLSRVLYGARVSLLVAFLSVCVSGSVGTLLGM